MGKINKNAWFASNIFSKVLFDCKGQKQRMAIARVLVSHPKIVLADEPTAALDGKTGRDVVELMQQLAINQGCTILIVTHDHRILDVADRKTWNCQTAELFEIADNNN